MGFLMSVFLAFTMSLFSPIVAGAAVEPMGLLMGTLSGIVIGTVVMAALPGIPLAVSCGAKEGSLSWFLLKDVLLCTIMYLILSLCLNAMVSGIDASFVNRWLAPAPLLWIICYVVAIQVEPLCMFLSCKITRTQLSFGAPEAAPEAEGR